MTDTATPDPAPPSKQKKTDPNMNTHLIIAVHGIGEQKPGDTVDSIVGAATATFYKDTDGADSVLVEKDVISLSESGFSDEKREAELFPVHLRRVRRALGASPGEQAVFAEVYWADKSPAPEGAIGTSIDLLRVVLGLGYLAMENVEANRHRLAVYLVHAFTILFYFFVAPINAAMVIGAALLMLDMTPIGLKPEWVLELLAAHACLTIAAGTYVWLWKAKTYLVRLFGRGLTFIGVLILVVYLSGRFGAEFGLGVCAPPSAPRIGDYPNLHCFVQLSVDALGIAWFLTIFVALLLYVTGLCFPTKHKFWTDPEAKEPEQIEDGVDGVRAIYPSICAAMIIFWLVVSSSFWLLFLNITERFQPDHTMPSPYNPFPTHNHQPDSLIYAMLDTHLKDAFQSLAITTIALVWIIGTAVLVLLVRVFITWREGPPPKCMIAFLRKLKRNAFADNMAKWFHKTPLHLSWPEFSRVILNPIVRVMFGLWLIVIFCALLLYLVQEPDHVDAVFAWMGTWRYMPDWLIHLLSSTYGLMVGAAGFIPDALQRFIDWVDEQIASVTAALLILGLIIYNFSHFIANGLGVARDIVLYAVQERCKVRPPTHERAKNFPYRREINSRFRQVVNYGLETFDPSRVTIISHSQGTVIATQMLQSKRVKGYFKHQGNPPVKLITMGSPVTHIYRRYFKEFFQVSVEKMPPRTEWFNIFRTDDFVGTFIGEDKTKARTFEKSLANKVNDPVGRSKPDLATNFAVEAKGHSGYFTDFQVWRVFLDKTAVNFELFPDPAPKRFPKPPRPRKVRSKLVKKTKRSRPTPPTSPRPCT